MKGQNLKEAKGLGNTKPKGAEPTQILNKKLDEYNLIKNELIKNDSIYRIVENEDITLKSGAGNFRRKSWFFTIPWKTYILNHNYSSLEKSLKGHIDINKFAYQLEEGDSGYEHIQGVTNFKKEIPFTKMKTLLGDYAHIIPCKDLDAALRYCTKERSRIRDPCTYNYSVILDDENFDMIEDNPKPWQKMILDDIIKTRDDRFIYWFWSEKGGTGKSTFTRYLRDNYKACIIGGCDKDAAYMIDTSKSIFIFDIVRGDGANIDYKLLEHIKNKTIPSTKYESCIKTTRQNLLIVFANKPPDKFHNLSDDRLKVFNIDH